MPGPKSSERIIYVTFYGFWFSEKNEIIFSCQQGKKDYGD